MTSDFLTGGVAMLGTTLTSYVYLWQTMQQANERPPDAGLRYRIRECVAVSLGTVVLFGFILIATGATLGTRQEEVTTAERAAQALAPIAGRYASDVFGAGLLVSALVALPVLMATTGNVIAVQLRAPVALRAAMFTAAIVIATAVALAMVVGLQIPPVRLPVIASVIGG
jgi:Mn2+/Fe2+ NRAMP family transporter